MKEPAGRHVPDAQAAGQVFEGAAVGVPYPLESASPSRPVDAVVSRVSPMLKPLCVPVTAKVRVILSHVAFGTWIKIFVPPPVAAIPRPVRMPSGSFSPHDRLVPVRVVVPVKFVKSTMSTSPVPGPPPAPAAVSRRAPAARTAAAAPARTAAAAPAAAPAGAAAAAPARAAAAAPAGA